MNDSKCLETRQETEEVAEMMPVADLPGAVDVTLDMEDQSMIENVNFTKRIVQVVADHPRFPARMTVGSLQNNYNSNPAATTRKS